MPKHNIKGQAPDALLWWILLATTLAVLLIFVIPKILDLLQGTAETGQCNVNFILTHLGDTEQLEGCKMNNVIITNTMLVEETEKAKKQYKLLETQNKLTPKLANAFKQPTDDYMVQWAFNKIIAQEMADCVDKTLGGKLLERTGGLAAYSTDTTCVVCSRIILTPEAKNMISTTNYYFDEWTTDVQYKDTTYKGYVTKANNIPNVGQAERNKKLLTTYPYNFIAQNWQMDTDLSQPLAVMLVNIPLGEIAGKQTDARWIQLYNYEDITKETGPYTQREDIILSTLGLEEGMPLKCQTIIGTG